MASCSTLLHCRISGIVRGCVSDVLGDSGLPPEPMPLRLFSALQGMLQCTRQCVRRLAAIVKVVLVWLSGEEGEFFWFVELWSTRWGVCGLWTCKRIYKVYRNLQGQSGGGSCKPRSSPSSRKAISYYHGLWLILVNLL